MERNSRLDDGSVSIDLMDYFRYALRKWKYIVASAGIALLMAAVYVYAIATPIYESTAQLYVVNSSDSILNLSDLQIGTYLTSDYQLVFDTWEVNQQVIQNLKLPYSVRDLKGMRKITNPGNTRALFITVQSSDAREAAEIANEYASVASRYISDTMQSDQPTILSMALEPIAPVAPKKARVVAVAFFAALCLSFVAMFIAYMLDDKVKTAADIQKITGIMPLGIIPVREKKRSGSRRR